MSTQPLDRLLSSQGFGTKKSCRTQIRRGVVKVEGEAATDPFALFEAEGLELEVEGQSWRARAQVVLAMHKTVGYECSRKPSHHKGVMELLPVHLRTRGVQPVGRLDQDSTGLLILTDDGALNHALASPKRHVSKVYRARCADTPTDALVARLLEGVLLRGDTHPTRAARCNLCESGEIELQINEGKYHQVKRMLAAAGTACVALHRTQVGALELASLGLEPGAWCVLEQSQIEALRAKT